MTPDINQGLNWAEKLMMWALTPTQSFVPGKGGNALRRMQANTNVYLQSPSARTEYIRAIEEAERKRNVQGIDCWDDFQQDTIACGVGEQCRVTRLWHIKNDFVDVVNPTEDDQELIIDQAILDIWGVHASTPFIATIGSALVETGSTVPTDENSSEISPRAAFDASISGGANKIKVFEPLKAEYANAVDGSNNQLYRIRGVFNVTKIVQETVRAVARTNAEGVTLHQGFILIHFNGLDTNQSLNLKSYLFITYHLKPKTL